LITEVATSQPSYVLEDNQLVKRAGAASNKARSRVSHFTGHLVMTELRDQTTGFKQYDSSVYRKLAEIAKRQLLRRAAIY
jgi:hypothetical protein